MKSKEKYILIGASPIFALIGIAIATLCRWVGFCGLGIGYLCMDDILV